MFQNLIAGLPRTKIKWSICHTCQGNGKVDNPAFSNGFTSDEWNDMDDEGRENYLGGVYDVPCGECRGTGKVGLPDMATLTFAEKRAFARERMNAKVEEEIRRDEACERFMEM